MLKIRFVSSLKTVSSKAWDSCANPFQKSEADRGKPCDSHNPFVSHAFLTALEESGCVSGKTGWRPIHVLIEDETGKLLGAAPCYSKSHSMGEYVFDQAWAQALTAAGGTYYPKLQVCAPFTPVAGPRLLLPTGPLHDDVCAALIEGLRHLQAQTRASSIHVTFLLEKERDALAGSGFLPREDTQFHWFNEGYGDFDDFLDSLNARKRKAIKRERREALQEGIVIAHLTGDAITESHWDAFFAFYVDTASRKWGRPYLNRLFFSLIGESMRNRILLIVAERSGRLIAGAINFLGDTRLYGRNWGCIEDHPFLHFEICYYQAIEAALSRGFSRVEAGAQGDHKLARGYRPITTYSCHEIANPGFKAAVENFLVREKSAASDLNRELGQLLPFKKNSS